jgi:ribosomal protein L7Ae-like RNA K-turn-binding protein
MSTKEILEAIGSKKVLFGIKEAVKNKKKLKSVFVSKDARDETVEKLESEKIEFAVLKSKEDISKELNLDFESEVYSILK